MVEKIGSSFRSPAPTRRLATITPEKTPVLTKSPTILQPPDTSEVSMVEAEVEEMKKTMAGLESNGGVAEVSMVEAEVEEMKKTMAGLESSGGVAEDVFTESEEGLCLAIEKRQMSLSVDYDSLNESISISGTTLLIRPTVTYDKLVSVDSRVSRGDTIDKIQIIRDNQMKCILGSSGEHLLASTGEVALSDLINREVRCCLRNQRARCLLELWDLVAPCIRNRLDYEHLNKSQNETRICSVSVVSRYEDLFLCIVLQKRELQETFELYDIWDEELSAGSGCDQLEKELETKWTRNVTVSNMVAMRGLMHLAAKRDPHTGGYCMVFRGGPVKPWSCIDLSRSPEYEGDFGVDVGLVDE